MLEEVRSFCVKNVYIFSVHIYAVGKCMRWSGYEECCLQCKVLETESFRLFESIKLQPHKVVIV